MNPRRRPPSALEEEKQTYSSLRYHGPRASSPDQVSPDFDSMKDY